MTNAKTEENHMKENHESEDRYARRIAESEPGDDAHRLTAVCYAPDFITGCDNAVSPGDGGRDKCTCKTGECPWSCRVMAPAAENGEETCCKCDVQIKYRVQRGKTVVTCPECGEIQPLCNECSRPERERNACDGCELLVKCVELNKMRAETRRKERE